jgi:hypothetical protein
MVRGKWPECNKYDSQLEERIISNSVLKFDDPQQLGHSYFYKQKHLNKVFVSLGPHDADAQKTENKTERGTA